MGTEKYNIVEYSSVLQEDWNCFVAESVNGTFLFNRNFMDYHKHRFEDSSLLVLNNDRISAIFPANIVGDSVFSHHGLTYGGLIVSTESSSRDIIDMFNAVAAYYKKRGVNVLYVKPTPYIYHSMSCEAIRYALFSLNAKLVGCGLSSAIDMTVGARLNTLRKRQILKAAKKNVVIKEGLTYLPGFYSMLTKNLKDRHGVNPVHTLDELTLLCTRFKSNIRLHTAHIGDTMLAGVISFVTKGVWHTQYIASTSQGRESGALDAVLNMLIDESKSICNYFDFGISTESDGLILNNGLLWQKESFGARAVTYEKWMINLKEMQITRKNQ